MTGKCSAGQSLYDTAETRKHPAGVPVCHTAKTRKYRAVIYMRFSRQEDYDGGTSSRDTGVPSGSNKEGRQG